jgi:hypothetical protein
MDTTPMDEERIKRIMEATGINEERKCLIEQLYKSYRGPYFDDPDLQADWDDRKRDISTWFRLWNTYRHPGVSFGLSDEERLLFESKYERCARVEKLRDVQTARHWINEWEIQAVRMVLRELEQEKVNMALKIRQES